MNPTAIAEAARLFIEARRTGQLLDALPASCRPQTVVDAHAIQEATIAGLGEFRPARASRVGDDSHCI